MSLLDASVALLTNVASNYLVGGEPPRRLGNAHPSIAPYEAFRARNGCFAVAAANQGQWAILCRVIDRPDLEGDPRFATNEARVSNRPALVEALGEVFLARDVDVWLAELRRSGLPCGPISDVAEVFEHPQAAARGLAVTAEHPTAGGVQMCRFPYLLSGTPAEVRQAPPLLGEHAEEVLTDLLGYSDQEVGELREQGVV